MNFLSKTSKQKLKGTALLRLDFNTEDEWRMEATLPTIRFLLKTSNKVVIISHRGRPKKFEISLSLRSDAENLSAFLKKSVIFVPSLKFPEVEQIVKKAPAKSVILLENLRFGKGEEKNNLSFAERLARLGDFYVNDAFAVSHRANASVVGITHFLPSYAGLELEKELRHLSHVLKNPNHPLVLILGGGKAHDKLGVIDYFRTKADAILLGGAAANTFLMLSGVNTKKSNVDKDAKDLRAFSKVLKYKNIYLPNDYEWSGNKILDIGPKAIEEFSLKIRKAKTVVWSGPMGLIERKKFERGTLALARAVASNNKVFSLAGGGETVMFLKKHKLDKKFSFISTGGGAMLDFLAGKKLPGLMALEHVSKKK